MKNSQILIDKDLIRSAIKLSEDSNSVETTMSFCKMGDFDGWCMKVVVCRHSVCESKDKEPKP